MCFEFCINLNTIGGATAKKCSHNSDEHERVYGAGCCLVGFVAEYYTGW
jgi:hypothetical protein